MTASSRRTTSTAAAVLLVLATLAALTPLLSAQNLQQQNQQCRLVTYIPFNDLRRSPNNPDVYGYGNWPDEATLSQDSISLLAAAEMARRHFVRSISRVQ